MTVSQYQLWSYESHLTANLKEAPIYKWTRVAVCESATSGSFSFDFKDISDVHIYILY